MLFSSLIFLFMFFPLVTGLYYLSNDKFKNCILLVASIIFYAWGEPVYVWLMILATIFNYLFGFLVCNNNIVNIKLRKTYLIISILFNVGILFIFKYSIFIVDNINLFMENKINAPKIILPLGISFYTFKALSYVIDIYNGKIKPQKNLFNMGLYITLFPQLLAGPISRYETVGREIERRIHSADKFAEGVRRFLLGLSKKIIISNQMGLIADKLFAVSPSELSLATTWMAILAYTLQIFFDFSGYSDMAIGLGKMFGFEFIENFNYPYMAQSVTEFWRKWHISLSSWFRDYVYIPLGGNRCNKAKVLRNILIVWMLTGFWHGASWTFIMWGLYYGVLLILEKQVLGVAINKLWRPIRHLYLILIVMVGWVFFRADNFTYSFEFIKNMFGINGVSLISNEFWIYLRDYGYVFILGIVFSTPICKNVVLNIQNKYPDIIDNKCIWVLESSIYACLFGIVIMHLVNSNYNPFIYFQF